MLAGFVHRTKHTKGVVVSRSHFTVGGSRNAWFCKRDMIRTALPVYAGQGVHVTHNPDNAPSMDGLSSFPLLTALLQRRSRRFGSGFTMNKGPLGFTSDRTPAPLSVEEQAALAFAACGITSHVLADLPFDDDAASESGGGNILMHLLGRTVPSGDGAHTISVFLIDDHGTWLLKRPQDYPPADVPQLLQAARERRLTELFERSRVRLSDRRSQPPREVPYVLPFNKWSTGLPGSTTFLPVAELTGLAINALLAAFSEEAGYYLVDERNRFRSAGLTKFARSKGGHLYDDPAKGRVATMAVAESWLYEFAAIEQGAILQNLGLTVEALGLGGFPYFAAHPSAWPDALGFRMDQLRFSRSIGAGPQMRWLLKRLRRDFDLPVAVGLEQGGEVLIKPFCPPYYRTIEDAVLAFVDYKFEETSGSLKGSAIGSAWRDPGTVKQAIPRPSDAAIAATIAYCGYAHNRYGRFPPGNGPFRTVLAFDAHRPDWDFYRQFYRADLVHPSRGSTD
jgi:hypothetical protein